MVRLLHPTNNKEKHTSRGQYKAQVLSRYHRQTQNRKQYILDNNIKSTKYLTGDNNKYHNHWPQHQAHLWGLKPPHHTHLGIRFFKPEYISIIQDSFSLLSWCRNVTLRSPQYSFILLSWCKNVTLRSPQYSFILLSWCRNVTLQSPTILVSERNTRSSTILVSERDTRSSTILVSERDTRSSIILVSERDTPIPYYPGVGTWHCDPLLS